MTKAKISMCIPVQLNKHHLDRITPHLIRDISDDSYLVSAATQAGLCLTHDLRPYIMITYPCVLYPLTPHFYIVKLGFTGVYIIFLFLL